MTVVPLGGESAGTTVEWDAELTEDRPNEVVPLGRLATAVIFDVVYFVAENSAMAIVAYWMVVAGVIGGLAAGLFGWLDWLAIPPGTPLGSPSR